jgi:hypothetical protein
VLMPFLRSVLLHQGPPYHILGDTFNKTIRNI